MGVDVAPYFPQPQRGERSHHYVILHPYTMGLTDDENTSAANSNRAFFRPVRGSRAVARQFTHGSRRGLRSFARFAGFRGVAGKPRLSSEPRFHACAKTDPVAPSRSPHGIWPKADR